MQMKAITGNSYPVRDKLKALGGRWDQERRLWYVPENKWDEASKLVQSAPRQELSKVEIIAFAVKKRGGTPGICSMCGDQCKYPYDECWGCKEERDMGY